MKRESIKRESIKEESRREIPGKEKKNRAGKKTALFLACCCAAVSLQVSAAPQWKQTEGAENTQGDKKTSGKADTTGEIPVYGAIGNMDENSSMDIDGDGTADLTIPRADLIEVSVTPTVAVNVYMKEGTVVTDSAEGVLANKNSDNQLEVTLTELTARDDNAKKIKITKELDLNAEDGLDLSIYAPESPYNAFYFTLGNREVSLANTAQNPPVQIPLGTLTEKGGDATSGTYLFKADCRESFINKYKDLPITYEAVYKFTIKK